MNISKYGSVLIRTITIASATVAYAVLFSLHSSYARAQTANISVWWPTDGATISGVQPFKALVDGRSIDQYEMYWQVDGGQLNNMSSNNTDSPHKEASVDVSGWHWSAAGSYVVGFIAKDLSGSIIAEQQVTIHANAPTGIPTSLDASAVPSPSPVASASPSPDPASAPVQTQTPSPSPSLSISPSPIPSASPSPVFSPLSPTIQVQGPAASSQTVNVWWPTDGVTVTGDQPFKAVLQDQQLSAYSIYWQVDGGQLNGMSDNYVDSPHKEAEVDLSGWSWKGTGPYVLTFIARDQNGNELGRTAISIYTGPHSAVPSASASPSPVVSASPAATVTASPGASPDPLPSDPAPVEPPAPAPNTSLPPVNFATISNDPLSGLSLYVDPHSNAEAQATAWSTSSPADAAEIEKIASAPQAMWFGDWNADIASDTRAYVGAAAKLGQVPILIAYDIPDRDCGGYSAGGATSTQAYRDWIAGFASGIGSERAVVILEPDALAMIDCLSSADAAMRYSLLSGAISTLKAGGGTTVYVDAGNSNWIGAGTMSQRLASAGVSKADGFALNVSNYYWTNDNVDFGQAVSSAIGGKHFVIDTSRNGLGPDGSNWCNPSGRALGAKPTDRTGNPLVDAFLWLKRPGESDGYCNGGPAAGVWWSLGALGLAERAAY